jgi:quinol monooxygenase YgiN
MTVLINGTVDFSPEQAEAAMKESAQLMKDTRDQKGCNHYVWSLDPAVPGRVYVYENWDSSEDLNAHLAGEYYSGMLGLLGKYEMLGTDILKYRIDLAEPVYDPEGVPRGEFFTG